MSTKDRTAGGMLALGAVNGLLSVLLGAFAAHALDGKLGERYLNAFEKAVDYQAMHALALLAVGLLCLQRPTNKAFRLAGILFNVGILLFCGSLYALALSGIGKLGLITPFGGSAFIFGWLALAWGSWRLGASISAHD